MLINRIPHLYLKNVKNKERDFFLYERERDKRCKEKSNECKDRLINKR